MREESHFVGNRNLFPESPTGILVEPALHLIEPRAETASGRGDPNPH
jgi:hypothetical protein